MGPITCWALVQLPMWYVRPLLLVTFFLIIRSSVEGKIFILWHFITFYITFIITFCSRF